MEKTTYLLGAGASANCLPIYSNFNQRFYEFENFIQNNVSDIKNTETDLYKNLHFYNNELRYHNTPDTYAKKLFHTKTTAELSKFKDILTLFFLYEQLQDFSQGKTRKQSEEGKQPFDKRYDAFIAALLKPISGKKEFLENIQILTWNYDMQFEIAYLQYCENKNIDDAQNELQSLPKLNKSFIPVKPNSRLSLIHLNGIAYPNITQSSFEHKIGFFYHDKKLLAKYLLEIYALMQDEFIKNEGSNLSFAWENLNSDYKIGNPDLQWALAATEKTEVLIITGYSFPIFNRAIDAELIQNMKSLKGIYIQDRYGANNIKQILETFVSRNLKNKIIDLGFYSQFYIPEMFVKPKSSIDLSALASQLR